MGSRVDLILQPPLAVTQVRERETDMALALVVRIVHRDQQPLSILPLPSKGDKAVVGPVALSQ